MNTNTQVPIDTNTHIQCQTIPQPQPVQRSMNMVPDPSPQPTTGANVQSGGLLGPAPTESLSSPTNFMLDAQGGSEYVSDPSLLAFSLDLDIMFDGYENFPNSTFLV